MTTPEPRPTSAPGTDPTIGVPAADAANPPTIATGGTTPAPPQQTPPRPRRTGRTIGRSLAAALLVFVTVVLVLFVMFNTQTVQISLVFTDVQAPLVLALVIAAVLGALVAGLLGAVMRARRRNR